jgi:cell division transport system permease protein
MKLYLKRAFQDIQRNRLLNAITIIIIAFSVIIVSAFILFLINAESVFHSWEKDLRMMVYLKPDIDDVSKKALNEKLRAENGILETRFISKEEALQLLKAQMKHQKSLLDGLRENPLPEAFEIRIKSVLPIDGGLDKLASRIEALSGVDEVEYGRQWIGKAITFFHLFRFAGIAMGGLFFIAAIFIVANTIRLLLYSRQDEIEIMRLIGASERFIKAPFYIEGLLQGLLGAVIGIVVLYGVYYFISLHVRKGFTEVLFQMRFISFDMLFAIIVTSMLIGWIGCFLSLKKFVKV